MPLDITPEYALSFSASAVHLLRRNPHSDGGGWSRLGSVEFSAPGFRADLAALRDRAQEAGAGEPLPVMLLIPQDQILYTSLAIPPGPGRAASVGRALDGLTPYAIEELSFDWAEEGSDVRVAAVARQTLIEAQEFATRHGFLGMGYSAQPENGEYPGMPEFQLPPDAETVGSGMAAAADPAEAGPLSLDLDADQPETTGEDDRRPEKAASGAASAADEESSDRLEAGDPPATKASAGPAESLVPPEAGSEEAGPNKAGPEADSADDAAGPTPTSAVPVSGAGESGMEDPQGQGTDGPATTVSPQIANAPELPRAPVQDRPVQDRLAAIRPGPGGSTARPQGPPVVVRHGPPPHISPTSKPSGDSPRAEIRPAPRRGGLLELLAMLAALVVGLLLVWAFLVPDDNPVADPRQVVAQAPADMPPDDAQPAAPEDPALPVATTPDEPADAGATADAAVDPDPAAETPAAVPAPGASAELPAEGMPPADVTAGQRSVAADDLAPLDTPPALASALSPVEQALVVAAATAPLDMIATGPDASSASVSAAPAGAAAAAEAATAGIDEDGIVNAATAPLQASIRPIRPAPASRPDPSARPAPPVAAAPAGLSSSARPAAPSRRPAIAPTMDSPPEVPGNPLPFAAAQRDVAPSAAARPPARPPGRPAAAAAPPAAAPSAAPAPAASSSAPVRLQGSARPPARPQGALPDSLADEPLSPSEMRHLQLLREDLYQRLHEKIHLRVDLWPAERDGAVRFAQARPAKRPPEQSVQQSAVEDAVRSAAGAPPPPVSPEASPGASPPASRSQSAENSAMPARDSGGLLNSSRRPRARPAGLGGGSADGGAITSAIGEAIASSPPTTAPSSTGPSSGGVALTALTSSNLPPRRADGAAPAYPPAANPSAANPSAAATAVAAAPGLPPEPSAAELAERRRLDEQLQAQAEARIRARAQADAAAEARARAEAEARARAQVAAEERAAAAQRQTYRPPELDDEPEVASNNIRGGETTATVAASATQARALDTRRTTIIGIIGAGKASRALIRLRNGKIVTVRLGDKIDGGTINSIGDGRLTYVKNNRQHELRMLGGR